jgi:cell fate regulator YaaT (PSP1 superfamily)
MSCDKKSVFDWLGNMRLPTHQAPFDIFEVRFKNGRKEYFRNVNNLNLCMGEAVAVEGSPGHDIGSVSLSGELVKVQMQKRKIAHDSEEVKKIYRKATQNDIDVWQNARDKEAETQKEARIIIDKLNLQMKLSDVEYQGDGKKAVFFYTAETRIDFRQLIKDLAARFTVRIEMKQVDYRHEAARLGGIGSCGRELCCSTWLTDFRKVNTTAARYQQLSLSPQKLQGQCGRLKCCLNYELDSYMDALKDFPDTEIPLETEKGSAYFIKMDIFKGILWYAYNNNEDYKWYSLNLLQVKDIVSLNASGKKAKSLSDIEIVEEAAGSGFENVIAEDSLTRFDRPKSKNRNKNRNRNKNNDRNNNAAKETEPQDKFKNADKPKIVIKKSENTIVEENSNVGIITANNNPKQPNNKSKKHRFKKKNKPNQNNEDKA